jgi:hypothetical protein
MVTPGTRQVIDLDHQGAMFRDANKGSSASFTPAAVRMVGRGGTAAIGLSTATALYTTPSRTPRRSVRAVSPGMPRASRRGAYGDPLILVDVDSPVVQGYRRVLPSWSSPGGA